MSKKVKVKVFKGPHYERVENMAYGYLHKILSEEATKNTNEDTTKGYVSSSKDS